MQTKIAATSGMMLFLMGMVITLGDPSRYLTPITEDFLGDVSPYVWGGANALAGISLMVPGYAWRKRRHFAAGLIAVMWSGISIWPLLTDSDINRVSLLGVIGWLSWATLIVWDSYSPVFDPQYAKYKNNNAY